MVLINKQPKLSCHMASMVINDRRLIKPVKIQKKNVLKEDENYHSAQQIKRMFLHLVCLMFHIRETVIHTVNKHTLIYSNNLT